MAMTTAASTGSPARSVIQAPANTSPTSPSPSRVRRPPSRRARRADGPDGGGADEPPGPGGAGGGRGGASEPPDSWMVSPGVSPGVPVPGVAAESRWVSASVPVGCMPVPVPVDVPVDVPLPAPAYVVPPVPGSVSAPGRGAGWRWAGHRPSPRPRRGCHEAAARRETPRRPVPATDPTTALPGPRSPPRPGQRRPPARRCGCLPRRCRRPARAAPGRCPPRG